MVDEWAYDFVSCSAQDVVHRKMIALASDRLNHDAIITHGIHNPFPDIYLLLLYKVDIPNWNYMQCPGQGLLHWIIWNGFWQVGLIA